MKVKGAECSKRREGRRCSAAVEAQKSSGGKSGDRPQRCSPPYQLPTWSAEPAQPQILKEGEREGGCSTTVVAP